ncbi:hypothetical protein SAMN05216199_0671 [Pedococcus cremeus]|uniref:Uncharacterized protein n=1 Tax=Pedococcus cremeus TaxID=587636 RepID=A0A1H9QKS8_9MICO|nr:hypothetical protein SAMN05216199_0671 [Pedococcus cremeus]
MIEKVATDLGITDDAVKTLVRDVRRSLWLHDDRPLAMHASSLEEWRLELRRARSQKSFVKSPPPVVALLAVYTLAAHQMGADNQFAANAYRPRLQALLQVPATESRRFDTAFSNTSEDFWRSVNEYLEMYEGQLGMPTAYALGHRYVGIPQSQALVRSADRRRLPQFFRMFGFAPGAEVIPGDLERLLDLWIGQNPSPVTTNLQRLWRGGKARERIAGVVSVELAHWDGSYDRGDTGETPIGGELQLTALLRRRLGGQNVELSFAARFAKPVDVTELQVKSAEGVPTVSVVPAAGGRLRPAPASRFDEISLVGANVTLAEGVHGQTATRQPRRVVPLHRDDLLGVFVEAERMQLAEDAMILVKDEPTLTENVLEIVGQHGCYDTLFACEARDGVVAMPGLPEGWLLVDGVQIYAVPQDVKRADLNPLIPLTSAQLTLAGGMKLPGRVRKWSSHLPPEIRAAVTDARKLEVILRSMAGTVGDPVELAWVQEQSMIVVPLADEGLGDGDYEISLRSDGVSIAQSTLRLRSGDTPDLIGWETCTRLVHELDVGRLGALSATEMSGESDLLVDGPRAIGAPASPAVDMDTSTSPGWATQKGTSVQRVIPVVLGEADPNSCLVTGMHRLELPTFMGGYVRGHIDGVCTGCGLVKRFPARPRAKKRQAKSANEFRLDIAALPPRFTMRVDPDSCLDALIHLGGGPIGALERVATQSEGSSLFVDEFVRTLEVLGHIDVRRDDRLLPVEWEVTPCQLAELQDGRFLLTGAWSDSRRADLGSVVSDFGGRLTADRPDGAGMFTQWTLRGVDLDAAQAMAEEIGDCDVAPDAAWQLLCALPTLGEVEAALPLVDIPAYTKAQVFDLDLASWQPIPGVARAGAYRLEQSFRSVTLWIDEDGARRRQGRLASVQLVKHLAARAAGRPLLAHLPQSQTLVTALGADLPGLYGRVAALCSGAPPSPSPKTRCLAYPGVPSRVARGLTGLMSQ